MCYFFDHVEMEIFFRLSIIDFHFHFVLLHFNLCNKHLLNEIPYLCFNIDVEHRSKHVSCDLGEIPFEYNLWNDDHDFKPYIN